MASVLKNDELDVFSPDACRACERGSEAILSQMTDEASARDNGGGTGNLSNVPLHMADVGTDNYDQEFTLGPDRERTGDAGAGQRGPGSHGKRERSGTAWSATSRSRSRGFRRFPTRGTVSSVHGSWRAANESARESVGLAGCSSSGRSPWAGPRSISRPNRWSSRGSARRRATGVRSSPTSSSCTPATTPAPLGVRGDLAVQQPDLRRPLGRRGPRRSATTFSSSARPHDRVLTIALGLIMAGAMGNCYDRLVFGHVRDFVHFHVDADRLRLRDLQFRRQHAGRRRRDPGASTPCEPDEAMPPVVRTGPVDAASVRGFDDPSEPGALAFSDVLIGLNVSIAARSASDHTS